MENNHEVEDFFQCLGEIWRDITAIEFFMRCAIAKFDKDIDKLPKPPYLKNTIYTKYPKSFGHFSFEIIVEKFNKRFPDIQIVPEIVQLRNAMAHGLIAEIDNSRKNQLIKFRENLDGTELKIEFELSLELNRITQIRQSLKEIRRFISIKASD